jgi:hypothetical protein
MGNDFVPADTKQEAQDGTDWGELPGTEETGGL